MRVFIAERVEPLRAVAVLDSEECVGGWEDDVDVLRFGCVIIAFWICECVCVFVRVNMNAGISGSTP